MKAIEKDYRSVAEKKLILEALDRLVNRIGILRHRFA